MDPFVHLHLHSQYSLLDGANKIPDVLEHAYRMGQPAIALTDHGNLHGAIEFYSEAKRIGIKPIIGCELYVTSGSRHDRRPKNQGGPGTHHLTILCQDLEGYRNLCKLVSLAYKEGFYFKPRVDHELLERYSAGLVALSGCLAGELNDLVSIDRIEEARNLARFYAKVFPDRFYLELQPHILADQQKLNLGCVEIARDIGLPLVATTDCHYPTRDDHFAQEILMCISTGKLVTDPTHIKHEGVTLFLKSHAEMMQEFGATQLGASAAVQEALRNTVAIAERCNVRFDFNTYYMPKVKEEGGLTLIQSMATQARDGLQARMKAFRRIDPTWNQDSVYTERLELEIGLIDKMGFAGYFLVVSDFIIWAKEHGIPVGPGRGSVAGSLVAFAMRITEVDPIRHKLLFERFLNPERVSLPDIDVDFCIHGRDRVIQYVVERYGKENVAQIATFGTLKAKAAIKDVGRALGLSYAETDRVAQLIPTPRQGFDYSITESLKMEEKLAQYARTEGKQLIELAIKLEGLTRHTSTHAAGVVIGDRPLMELLPMMVDKEGHDVTQYSMKYVEKVGLVKFDFLGLKTLTVLHTALRIIKESRKVSLDLEFIPLDDRATFDLLCSGNTTGVFQLESGGITEMTIRLKPSSFDDLVAILALYRPGPLDAGMVDHYIQRKHGREPVTYLHPLMKNSLHDTYGIILYQEQIMQLARELAGYTLAEADILRKAMGKKNPEEMAKQRDRFMSGTAQRSISKSLATEIFDQMETFARYGFNRSHSAAYALVSYHTAYLKAHYGVEFMAALMSHEMDDSDKILKNLNECRKQKIAVLPPDVNESLQGFSVRGGKVRYGLEAVKGIGEKAVLAILDARAQGGAFAGLEDFATRVDGKALNKRVYESLIRCGAFDFSQFSRRELSERLDDVIRAAQSVQQERETSQISLFGSAQGMDGVSVRSSNRPEWPVNQKLAFEREALGFYISGHPLEKFANDLKRLGTVTTADIKKIPPARPGAQKYRNNSQPLIQIGGVVTALKLKNTKKGDRYATFTLEDWLGTMEAIVWPNVYREISHLMVADDPVIVGVRADVTEERCVLIVEKMESLIAIRDRNARQGILVLSDRDQFDERVDRLLSIFKRHEGPCPLRVKLTLNEAEVSVNLKGNNQAPISVLPSESLCEEVEQLFGRPVLSFL